MQVKQGAPVACTAGADELLTVERVAVLHKLPLFATVPGHDLVSVARLLEEVRVDAGDTFIEQGAVENWLYLIADGVVRVHIGDHELRVIGSGGVVGDLAVLAPAPRSASVTAIEPTLLLRLRSEPFDELLEDHPEIARAIISTLAGMLQSVPVVDRESPTGGLE
jgi:CRP/FNR family cyclic AMP-dependent transcriptional regulator